MGAATQAASGARRASLRERTANRHVSQRLRELRRSRGLSQSQTAELLNAATGSRWTMQSISRAELCRGAYIHRWSVDDLWALAAAFDVPITYFLQDQVTPRRR
jgi:transcriptional regulator with XRE-family HTH domain